ncbi:hypothetical protein [Halomonas faecis]|uniref:hypothetical protein n=1 Tax=Halomonas faecis TaxID=1562110 RepID=UPI001F09C8DA|nr:hypothetical protein [Halomonas faecis]
MRVALILLLSAWLMGCAATSPAPETRGVPLAVSSQVAQAAVLDVLAERGYVIRHADAELGRVDAVLARWPGYRVRATVTPDGSGSRATLSATWGGRPLPPDRLDPLLSELETRLAADP